MLRHASTANAYILKLVGFEEMDAMVKDLLEILVSLSNGTNQAVAF